jgi:hypothetical protein
MSLESASICNRLEPWDHLSVVSKPIVGQDDKSGLLRAYRKPRKGNCIKTFPEGMLAVGIKSRTSKGFEAKD